jgi:hypothetical protein
MRKLIFTVLFILPSFSLAGNLHCKKPVEEMIGESQRCFYQGGLSDAITAFSKYSAQWNKKKGESIPFLWFPILKNGIPKTTVTMAQLPKSHSVTPFSETKDYPLETIVAGIEWKNKNKVKIMGCVYETDYCLSATFIQKENKVFIESIST